MKYIVNQYCVVMPLDYSWSDVQFFQTEQDAKEFIKNETKDGLDTSYWRVQEVHG